MMIKNNILFFMLLSASTLLLPVTFFVSGPGFIIQAPSHAPIAQYGTRLGPPPANIFGEPVTDYDGNVYHTVSIGKQIWLLENLKTTHYTDGTPITYNEAWTVMEQGAYGWYDDDTAEYKKTYGTLYNWFAVGSGKLCPKGWHVPTEEEWAILINYLGGETTGGEKMKVPASFTPAWDGNNASGFAALPSGQRSPSDGVPSGLGNLTSFWSSTENGTGAWYHTLYTRASRISSAYIKKTYGFSVRCIKD